MLSVTSSLPAGVTASFGTNPVTGGAGTSTLTVLTTSGSTPGGSYTLTIQGTSGTLTNTATVTLNVADFTSSRVRLVVDTDVSLVVSSPG
jgi:hypothetical protein